MSDVNATGSDEQRSAERDELFEYRIEQVEIRWLPMGEAAFLLWVLVVLLAVWLGIGVALGLV